MFSGFPAVHLCTHLSIRLSDLLPISPRTDWLTVLPSILPPKRFPGTIWRTAVWKQWPNASWPPSERIRSWSWSVDLLNFVATFIWANRSNLCFPGFLWGVHRRNGLILLMNLDRLQKDWILVSLLTFPTDQMLCLELLPWEILKRKATIMA